MSEEEKKAIEILEAVGIKCDGIDVYKTIKNLIEKQQQEIEILTEITKTYNAFPCNKKNQIIIADKEYFNRGYFNKYFICKDIIREKIKEIKNYTYMSNEEMKQQDYAIIKLEELLEGNE